ncbi:glycosyltransferase [Flavobacterium sp. W21_SRS_FM6]|uniref:glycosyltransferase n=1 Tax=Flavobacterium sp. W21_SRS_FM6 TaxID=3240268 RepID=UPI003F939351
MRILFLSAHKYLPELCGGMEINTHDMIKLLMQQGHHVSVCAGFLGGGILGLKSRINRLLKSYQWVESKYTNYNVYRSFNIIDDVVDIINKEKPDCVILQGGANYYELLDKIALNFETLKVISYFHTPDALPLNNAAALPKKFKYIANSQYTKNLHADKNIDLVLPPLFFKENYIVDNANGNYAVLVNPSIHKGVEIALALANKNPDVDFLFVVNNKSKKIDFLAQHLPTKNIEIVGPFSNMKEVYKQAKVILMPSIWNETWGRVATEAHYSSIPVLSSNNGGLPESVGIGGISLPANSSIDDWNEAFCRLWYDTNGEYKKAVIEHAKRDEIDPKWNVNSLIKLITSM